MDYAFWSSIKGLVAPRLVVSYDIGCQWNRHLLTRRADLPDPLTSTELPLVMEYVIPKFHITAHVKKCQDLYSLYFKRNMGHTDGENIERGWAWMNPAALSTREMGPGMRRDSLDDQWAFWNHRILVQLGKCYD